jgi:acetyl esterase
VNLRRHKICARVWSVFEIDTRSTSHDTLRTNSSLGRGAACFRAKPWVEDRFHAYLQESVDRHSPEVSTLFATELSGVAVAVIVTADHDPLHDEGEAYAEKLKAAGVPVDYTCWPGMVHGLVSMAEVVDAGKVLIEQIGMALREALA